MPNPDLQTMERELRNTRQEVRNLQVMQMRPGQSAADLKLLNDLERSARAEVKLRVKALAQASSQQREASQASPTGTYRPRAGAYLMSAQQHRERAAQIKARDPNSRAALLHELAAKLQQQNRKP